jgi:hypothetical protein
LFNGTAKYSPTHRRWSSRWNLSARLRVTAPQLGALGLCLGERR